MNKISGEEVFSTSMLLNFGSFIIYYIYKIVGEV